MRYKSYNKNLQLTYLHEIFGIIAHLSERDVIIRILFSKENVQPKSYDNFIT